MCGGGPRDPRAPRRRAVLTLSCGSDPPDLLAHIEHGRRHNMDLVGEAGHCVDGWVGKERVGTMGDFTCFSFSATKNLTTGEGGMVTANDSELMERMRRLALHGINRDAWNRYAANGKWFYTVTEPGFKYNLTDIASAIGLQQLPRQERFLQERQVLRQHYQPAFGAIQ